MKVKQLNILFLGFSKCPFEQLIQHQHWMRWPVAQIRVLYKIALHEGLPNNKIHSNIFKPVRICPFCGCRNNEKKSSAHLDNFSFESSLAWKDCFFFPEPSIIYSNYVSKDDTVSYHIEFTGHQAAHGHNATGDRWITWWRSVNLLKGRLFILKRLQIIVRYHRSA